MPQGNVAKKGEKEAKKTVNKVYKAILDIMKRRHQGENATIKLEKTPNGYEHSKKFAVTKKDVDTVKAKFTDTKLLLEEFTGKRLHTLQVNLARISSDNSSIDNNPKGVEWLPTNTTNEKSVWFGEFLHYHQGKIKYINRPKDESLIFEVLLSQVEPNETGGTIPFNDGVSEKIQIKVKKASLWVRIREWLVENGEWWAPLAIIVPLLIWVLKRINPKSQVLRKLISDPTILTPRSDRRRLKLSLQKYIRNSGIQDVEVFASNIQKSGKKTCLISSEGRPFGSGVLVGEDKILTNYHVLREIEAAGVDLSNIQAVFDYSRGADGRTVDGGVEVKLDLEFEPIVSPVSTGERYDEQPENLDYAFLKLQENIGLITDTETRGFFQMRSSAVRLEEGQDVIVFHHPQAEPVQLSFGQVEEPVEGRVRYDATTLYGSSGGAVLNAKFELAALHQAGDGANPPKFNQGIPIHLIKKDIERQLNDGRDSS